MNVIIYYIGKHRLDSCIYFCVSKDYKNISPRPPPPSQNGSQARSAPAREFNQFKFNTSRPPPKSVYQPAPKSVNQPPPKSVHQPHPYQNQLNEFTL